MNYWKISLLLATRLLLIPLTGCSLKDEIIKESLPKLSEQDVVKALEHEGFRLESTTAENSLEDEVNLNPAAYKINNTEDKLFIYTFNFIADRKEVFPERTASENDNSKLFSAKNVVILYRAADDSPYFINNISIIEEVVFSQLHDLKHVTFEGEGDIFDVLLDVNYYEYEWNDRDGNTNREILGRTSSTITYKGETAEQITELILSYSWQKDGEEINQERRVFSASVFDEEHVYSFRQSPFKNDFPRKNNVVDLIVKTNGVEESFQITGKPVN